LLDRYLYIVHMTMMIWRAPYLSLSFTSRASGFGYWNPSNLVQVYILLRWSEREVSQLQEPTTLNCLYRCHDRRHPYLVPNYLQSHFHGIHLDHAYGYWKNYGSCQGVESDALVCLIR